MKENGKTSSKREIVSRVGRTIFKGAGLFLIFLCPALFQIALLFVLDFQNRLFGGERILLSFGIGQFLSWGTLVLSALFCILLLRAICGKGILKKWSIWIVLIIGHILGIMLIFAMYNVMLASILATARCPQMIAALQQYMLDHDNEWIYYDDIVGPDGYLQTVRKDFGENPEDNFPMHRDAQEFAIALQNGWKIIWWSEVPIAECKSRPRVLTVKPNGKLHVVYDAKEEKEHYADYLEWKKDYIPPEVP